MVPKAFRALASVAVACLAACGSGARPPACPPAMVAKAPAPTPAAPPSRIVTPAPTLAEQLDLSFDARGRAGEWQVSGAGYEVNYDERAAHSGKLGLRVATSSARHDRSGWAIRTLPVEPARGKLVRLGGWIRANKLDQQAGLWILAKGPGDKLLGLGNMYGYGPEGSKPWSYYELVFEVPAGTEELQFGAVLYGDGEALFDDLKVSFEALAGSVEVQGLVLGRDGSPVAGALVAAVIAGAPFQIVTTDASGHFGMHLRSGYWAFTVTSEAGVAAYWPERELNGKQAVELRLGRSGFTLSGEVRATGELPAGARIDIARVSDMSGDFFVVRPGPDGKFAVRLPEARGYYARVEAEGLLSDEAYAEGSHDQSIHIDAMAPAAPPESVVEWIKNTAIRLASLEPGYGWDDLTPAGGLFAGARIVALGGLGGGSHELFQVGQRLLEYLVETQGFTIFATRAELVNARAANNYVLTGEGTAVEAMTLSNPEESREMLSFIEWMRAYNRDDKHVHKLQLVGIAPGQDARVWPDVLAYLRRVDPELAGTLAPNPSLPAGKLLCNAWQELMPEERQAQHQLVDSVVTRLDSARASYVKKSGVQGWRRAREDARAIAQALSACDLRSSEWNASVLYQEAMAENVAWLLAQEGPAAKMLILGTSGAVGTAWKPGEISLGLRLREKFGARYRALGFVFAEGSFSAFDQTLPHPTRHEVTLGPPAPTDVSQAFTRAGCALCVLDLRAARREIAAWFKTLQPMRDLENHYGGEQAMWWPHSLARLYDGVVFVSKITPMGVAPVD